MRESPHQPSEDFTAVWFAAQKQTQLFLKEQIFSQT